MRLFDLLIISICQWIVASNISFQSSSHRYLQDPDVVECNDQLVANAEGGSTVTEDTVLDFINDFFDSEYETFDFLNIRIQLVYFYQSGVDRVIEVGELDENGNSLILIFCNGLFDLFLNSEIAPSISPQEGSTSTLDPTAQPVLESTPTTVPLSIPTSSPNILSTKPSPQPIITSTDTQVPSISFSVVPSARPTMSLTLMPTLFHSESPTLAPSVAFSNSPTTIPTNAPIAPTSNPTNSPSITLCEDIPGWTDAYGDGCDWYEENDGCGIAGDCCESDEHTANTACCICKQYSIAPSPTPTLIDPPLTFQPTSQITQNPSICVDDDEWMDVFGDGCSWYRDNDPECNYANPCCHCLNKEVSMPMLQKTGMPTIFISRSPTTDRRVSPRPTKFQISDVLPTAIDLIEKGDNSEDRNIEYYYIGAAVAGTLLSGISYVLLKSKRNNQKDPILERSQSSTGSDIFEEEDNIEYGMVHEKSTTNQHDFSHKESVSFAENHTILSSDDIHTQPIELYDKIQENSAIAQPGFIEENVSFAEDQRHFSKNDIQTQSTKSLALRRSENAHKLYQTASTFDEEREKSLRELINLVPEGDWSRVTALVDNLGLSSFSKEDYDDSSASFSVSLHIPENGAGVNENREDDEQHIRYNTEMLTHKPDNLTFHSAEEAGSKGEEKDDFDAFDGVDVVANLTNIKNQTKPIDRHDDNDDDIDEEDLINLMSPIITPPSPSLSIDNNDYNYNTMSTLTNTFSVDQINEVNNEVNNAGSNIASFDVDPIARKRGTILSHGDEYQEKQINLNEVDSYDNESYEDLASEEDGITASRRAEICMLLSIAHPDNNPQENDEVMKNAIDEGPGAEIDLLESLKVMVRMKGQDSGGEIR